MNDRYEEGMMDMLNLVIKLENIIYGGKELLPRQALKYLFGTYDLTRIIKSDTIDSINAKLEKAEKLMQRTPKYKVGQEFDIITDCNNPVNVEILGIMTYKEQMYRLVNDDFRIWEMTEEELDKAIQRAQEVHKANNRLEVGDIVKVKSVYRCPPIKYIVLHVIDDGKYFDAFARYPNYHILNKTDASMYIKVGRIEDMRSILDELND